MKARRSVPALGAFFVVIALVIAGCGSSTPSNAVATVAGNPITTKALNHWMYVYAKAQAAQSPGAPVIAPNDPPTFTKCIAQVRATIPQYKTTPAKTLKADCKQLFTSLSSTTLGQLIQGYWFQALAHREGINVTDTEVQTALAKAKKQQFKTEAQYQAYLTQSGYTQDDINYELRLNQVEKKLLAKQSTTVTPADISAYYASHKSAFGTPERRSMRIVLAKSAAQGAAAKKALQKGQSWTVVAKKYSTDPTTKNKGGLLPDVTAGQQDAALSKAAFAASPNKLVGPVKGQFGYYVIDVIKVLPATQKTLAQSSTMIKTTLSQQKQQAAGTAITNAAKKAFGPRTQCRAQYAMADCKGYKAPKTATTPTAPSSGATAPSGGATAPSSGSTATAPSSSSAAPSSSTTTSSSSQ